ncbi:MULTISPECIES: hypothetical protein [unclassified Streptomyces]|uniref:hypothetical protein n=1 Tax=unclassified Streptomyces TaxID=2593676 RepID=UPI0036CA19ED
MLSLFGVLLSSPVAMAVGVLVYRHGGTALNHGADLASLRMSLRGTQPHERAAIIKALATWRKR